MRKLIILSAVSALLLTGCAESTEQPAQTPAPVVSAEATPAPTPTVDPGPVTLTIEEARNRYLQIVCPPNFMAGELTAVQSPLDEQWFAGQNPDVTVLHDVVLRQIDARRAAIKLFDDDYFVWPGESGVIAERIRASYVGSLAGLDQMSRATKYSELTEIQWPDPDATAGQEMRLELDLPVDTAGSCTGFEDGHEVLLAEQAEREVALGIDQ